MVFHLKITKQQMVWHFLYFAYWHESQQSWTNPVRRSPISVCDELYCMTYSKEQWILEAMAFVCCLGNQLRNNNKTRLYLDYFDSRMTDFRMALEV